jgi:hypothetical protein
MAMVSIVDGTNHLFIIRGAAASSINDDDPNHIMHDSNPLFHLYLSIPRLIIEIL